MNFSANDPQEKAKLQTQKEVIAPGSVYCMDENPV